MGGLSGGGGCVTSREWGAGGLRVLFWLQHAEDITLTDEFKNYFFNNFLWVLLLAPSADIRLSNLSF